jgi:ribokinase
VTSSRPRIAVVGSANVDLIAFSDRVPRPGETIFGTDFDIGWGGKGANQAVAARLCGAHVDMVARVGKDLFGPAMIRNLETHGVGTEFVRVISDVSSGVAPIVVDSSGQNRIIVVKGANERLTPADVDEALPVLSRADCIVLQLEIPIETVYHAIRIARRMRIRCLLNPAPARSLDMAVAADVDYVIPNEVEAEMISGVPARTVEDARKSARRLLEQGFSRVIVTLGENGALLAAGESSEIEMVPGFEVRARDTTGAGDAFIGSFSVFLAEGFGEREAIARANLYAALSTTTAGTQKSFPSRLRFDEEWRSRCMPS